MFMPFQVLGLFLRGLLSFVLLGAGIGFLTLWYVNREQIIIESAPASPVEEVRQAGDVGADRGIEERRVRVVRWQPGLNKETAYLAGAIALLAWSLGGGLVLSPRTWRKGGEKLQPRRETSHKTQLIHRPDGRELRVAVYGPADGDSLVFTHGWGLDSQEWFYAKRELGAYRIITWDLPGLGGSSRPQDRDWSLESLARDLDAVIEIAAGKPVTLVGHSIGTMIILTYCKLFPDAIGTRVSRIVLAHGTYTNPVRTTAKASLYTALQKPLIEPLCHLMIWFSPIVRILNWLSYANGSAHRSTERDSFSGAETGAQLEFITSYYCTSPPDVVAHGMLAMLRYDATDVLEKIAVPTLVVAGDSDKTCTPEASQYMASAIRHADLVVLRSAKHCGLFEWHEQFHEELIGFLAAHHEDSLAPRVTPAAPPRASPAGSRRTADAE